MGLVAVNEKGRYFNTENYWHSISFDRASFQNETQRLRDGRTLIKEGDEPQLKMECSY